MTNFGHLQQSGDFARLRPYAMASIGFFTLGALGGGLAIIFYPETAQQLQELLKQFVKMFHGMSKPQLAAAIFLNNSLKTLVVILLGPVLGLVPVFFLIINGAILGAVIPIAVASKGLWSALMTIIPHGIFELPAIFMGASIGIRLGMQPLLLLMGKADTTFLSELGRGLRLFATVILPLLVLAALIEVFVTPLVASF